MSINIGYTGEVHIVAGNNRYSSHNMGTPGLFRLLSNIFGRRDAYTQDDLPGNIMLYEEDAENVATSTISLLSSKALLSSFVPVNFYPETVTINGETVYQTVFTTYINNKVMSTTSVPTTVTLALVDSNMSNILAAIDLPASSGVVNSVMQGNQALIKWIMKFSNAE